MKMGLNNAPDIPPEVPARIVFIIILAGPFVCATYMLRADPALKKSQETTSIRVPVTIEAIELD